MLRIFFLYLIYLIPFYTYASTYTVKLAAFKDKGVLEEAISKLPAALRQTIDIEQNKKKYLVKTLLTQNKKFLISLLPAYKRVFPNAKIVHDDTVKPKNNNTSHTKEQTDISIPDKPESLYTILKDKTLYLCPEFRKSKNKKFLIKVTFGESDVTYSPLLGNIPPMTARYKIKENKLFIYQKGLFNPNVFNALEDVYFKYILMGSWVEKRRIQKLRYYFNLHDAQAYLALH